MGLFSSGGSAAQGKKTRSFSDIKGAAAEQYVQSHGDLLAAYNQMVANPAGVQGSYWLQKMGGEMSMAAFGEAHRGEDTLLFQGKYKGGTKVKAKDKTYFSAKNTMRPEGEKVGMRNPVGPSAPPPAEEPSGGGSGASTTSGESVDTQTGATATTTTQTNQAIIDIGNQLASLQEQLATAQETIVRSSLGIPYDAPSHIKTYEQYRAWLAEQSATTGFKSTVTSSMTGVDDYMANVKKLIMTSLNALPGS